MSDLKGAIMRVIYVIDHKRPHRERWSSGHTSTASISTSVDDAGAAELAARFDLLAAPITKDYQIRLRVWPEPSNLDNLLAFDADAQEPAGTWMYDPSEG